LAARFLDVGGGAGIETAAAASAGVETCTPEA
jgi:hypothetical protein